ncbi:MAG: hypothetical protein RL417_2293 [Pseudomonadota bacterium]
MFNPRNWNGTDGELAARYRCDEVPTRFDDGYLRAITIDASPTLVFGWLCQLRVAPYSYDWIDNFGRRSPRIRTPELAVLEGNERFMFIFDLVSFVPGEEITLTVTRSSRILRLLGECAITYRIVPEDSPTSVRLLVKLALRYPRGPLGWLLRVFLPTGDLIMMRKQLLTLKELAEGEMMTYSNTNDG